MSEFLTPEVLGVIGAIAFGLIVIFLFSLRKPRKIRIAEKIGVDQEKAALESLIKEAEVNNSVSKMDEGLSWLQRKERELNQSNTGVSLSLYLVILILSSLTVYTVVALVLGIPWLAIPFAFLGLAVPEQFVKARVVKNIDKFNDQLVKALRRMASVMRSGGSLKQALSDVARARSIPAEVRVEFTTVLKDVEYGDAIEVALFKLYERTGSKDVRYLAIAIEIQRALGGNMAQIFDAISQTISNRNMMQADVKATLAQAKASVTILSLLTPGLGSALWFMNPNHFDPMFESLTGRMIFLGCIASVIAGALIMRKMSTLDL